MFPWVSLFCVPKETQKTGESKPHCDPPMLWLELPFESTSSWIQVSSSASSAQRARQSLCLCINPSGPLSQLSSAVPSQSEHTVQIIQHSWGILHAHESISRELILKMLMPLLQVSYPLGRWVAASLSWNRRGWSWPRTCRSLSQGPRRSPGNSVFVVYVLFLNNRLSQASL